MAIFEPENKGFFENDIAPICTVDKAKGFNSQAKQPASGSCRTDVRRR